MGLAPGKLLSHFEIVDRLGAGGMGEVWRARDTRLGREVALKVLPDALADTQEWLSRFEREARALASLSHPGLATVFGIDRVDGVSFMAMELVPGEDLARRLERGPLPLAEALELCREIAAGLEAAHEAGVIHRDLKPANVMVTPEGRAKILDFGLAKPAGSASLDGAPVTATQPGRLLGTPTYMAPEQARGGAVDRRVDVWTFGCVLYECLTARRAFDGEELGEVLVQILEREPDWTAMPPATPAHVRALLARCLDKDPRRRLRDVGEARVALERGPAEAPDPAARSAGSRVFRLAMLPGAALLAAGVLLGRQWIGPAAPAASRTVQLQRLTELAGVEESPALSPDGRTMAFVSRVDGERQVFLRTKGAPQAITVGPGEHSAPRWVDEATLLYFRHPRGDGPGSLEERIVLSATPPRTLLAPAHGEADVSRDGRWIATVRKDAEGAALVVLERGGERRERVFRMPYGGLSSPRWSPDGRRLVFQALVYLARTELHLLDVDSGESRLVAETPLCRGLAWLPDGSGLVYASSQGSTLAYPPVFRLRQLSLEDGRDVALPLPDAGYGSYVEPDVAAGRLVASRVRIESDLYRYPVDGSPRENVERALRITHQTGMVQVPSASPDDQRVAYLSDSGGQGNIWVARVDGSEPPRQLTEIDDPETVVGLPVWSPRGDWIVCWRGRASEQSAELVLIRPDGGGERRLVRATGGAHWSADGEHVYFIAAEGVVGQEQPTYRIHVDGGEPELVRRSAVGMSVSSDGRTGYFNASTDRTGEIWTCTPLDGPATLLRGDLQSRIPLWPHEFVLSPDDQWLAAPLVDAGTTNLWLVSTADGSLREVTDFGSRPTLIGRRVSWSGDGRHLFAALMELDADVVAIEGALP